MQRAPSPATPTHPNRDQSLARIFLQHSFPSLSGSAAPFAFPTNLHVPFAFPTNHAMDGFLLKKFPHIETRRPQPPAAAQPIPNPERNPFSPANPRYPNPHNTNKPRCPLRKTCFRHFRKHRPLLTPITRKKRLSPHQNPPSKPAARNRQRQRNPSRTRSETLSHRQTRHDPNPMKTEAAASP